MFNNFKKSLLLILSLMVFGQTKAAMPSGQEAFILTLSMTIGPALIATDKYVFHKDKDWAQYLSPRNNYFRIKDRRRSALLRTIGTICTAYPYGLMTFNISSKVLPILCEQGWKCGTLIMENVTSAINSIFK